MSLALEQWAATDRLDRLRSRTLMIAAEHDHTPLAEKHALAARMNAAVAVIRGSRHGTPFDASEATNASLLALLTDQPLPSCDQLTCDTPARARAHSSVISKCEEYAIAVERRGKSRQAFTFERRETLV